MEGLRYRLDHKVEEEISQKKIRETLRAWPRSASKQHAGGEGPSDKRLQRRTKSCSDAINENNAVLVGWKDRVKFVMEQLKKWEHDPMLQLCHKHQIEKTLYDRSLTPVPDIQLLTPQIEEAQQSKRKVEGNIKYVPKYPLDAYSVHYQETGVSKDSYWERSRQFREEQVKYALSHRLHHTGYGLNPSLAKPRCVFPPVSRPLPSSTFLSPPTSSLHSSRKIPLNSGHSSRHCHANSASTPMSTTRKLPVLRIRCSTASRNFSTKIPRTPWGT